MDGGLAAVFVNSERTLHFAFASNGAYSTCCYLYRIDAYAFGILSQFVPSHQVQLVPLSTSKTKETSHIECKYLDRHIEDPWRLRPICSLPDSPCEFECSKCCNRHFMVGIQAQGMNAKRDSAILRHQHYDSASVAITLANHALPSVAAYPCVPERRQPNDANDRAFPCIVHLSAHSAYRVP